MSNDFLPFAGGSGANVLSQADYAALSAILSNGFTSGVAPSAQVNKVLRQSSILSAVVAQFISDLTGQNAVDDGTTTTLLANLKMAVGAQSVGIVGDSRNSRVNITTATSTATYTADEVIVETALGGRRYVLANVNSTINLATTGAGGMDAGSAPISGVVALYLIYNPTSGAKALLGVNATAAAVPEVYGGANMPIGFTASALRGLLFTNSSGQFGVQYMFGRTVRFAPVVVLTETTQHAAYTSFSISAAQLPLNAKTAFVSVTTTNNTAGQYMENHVASDVNGMADVVYSGQQPAINQGTSAAGEIPVPTPGVLFRKNTTAGGTATFNFFASGFSF